MIGILGGTFDPVHLGHISLAQDIQRSFQMNELRLIPCYLPVHRTLPQASVADRLKMLQLAIHHVPHLTIDEIELEARKACYSVDTLEQIRRQIGPSQSLAFILGMDAFNHFLNWKNPSRILELCHLIVVNRPGSPLALDERLSALLKKHQSIEPTELQKKTAGCIYLHHLSPLPFSATAIREQQASSGITEIDQYIQKQKLYRRPMELSELNKLIKESLEEAKALDISEIDVKSMTDVCDTLFICTATSGRHARSIERKLIESVKQHGIRPLSNQDNEDESWILVDLNQSVIHIMLDETRRFYNLEQLWDLTSSARDNNAD